MARQKAVQFILWTVSRTYGQLKAPFRRQPKRHSKRDFLYISSVLQFHFLYISFVFYGFISYIFLLYFTVLLKQLRRLYISGFIFQVPLVFERVRTGICGRNYVS